MLPTLQNEHFVRVCTEKMMTINIEKRREKHIFKL